MKCNSILDELIKYEELNKLEEMCAVHWASGYAAAAVHASCGESTICRDGLVQIREILSETESIRAGLLSSYEKCLVLYGKDYSCFQDSQKQSLGAIVNLTKALSAALNKAIE